jgi:hypothetical protein
MSFESDIQRFSKVTGIEIDKVVRTLAIKAFSMVTEKTPVDTGRARANWNLSVGKINVSVDSPKGYKKSTGKYRGSSSPPSDPKIPVPNIKKGDGFNPIYITNSLPYIFELEEGTHRSTQAPRGMVKVTINELGSYIA